MGFASFEVFGVQFSVFRSRRLVPKLPFGNAYPRSSASANKIRQPNVVVAKQSFADMGSQAGAWEPDAKRDNAMNPYIAPSLEVAIERD